MTLSQGHDTPLGHGQRLCEILSRSNMAMRSYGPDMDFGYVCTVTLTLEIWHWVKVMTHPSIMDNNCEKYYLDPTWQWRVMDWRRILGMCALWPWPWNFDLGSSSWHILGSWTTIVWNIIQIQHDSEGSWTIIVWNIIQIRQVVKKLWPGHDVNRRTHGQTDGRTDRRTDGQTDGWFLYTPQTLFAGGIITQIDRENMQELRTYLVHYQTGKRLWQLS